MFKNKFIYCFYVVTGFLFVLALESCTTSSKSTQKGAGKKEKFVADATPPTNYHPIFIKNKIDFDKFFEKNTNAKESKRVHLQISHAEIQEKTNLPKNLTKDLPKIRLYVQLSDTIGNYLQNANTLKNRIICYI